MFRAQRLWCSLAKQSELWEHKVKPPHDRWLSLPENLISRMIFCVQANIRDKHTWNRMARRCRVMSVNMTSSDLVKALTCFSQVDFREPQFISAISTSIVKDLHGFPLKTLIKILAAYRRMRYFDKTFVELVVNQICLLPANLKWEPKDCAQAVNAVSYFYIFHSQFWHLVTQQIHRQVMFMSSLDVALILAGYARIDLRHMGLLLKLGPLVRARAERGLFSQEALSTTINSLAKLDFMSLELCAVLGETVHQRLPDQLDFHRGDLSLSDFQFKMSKRDFFDLQSLVNMTYSMVCFFPEIPLETLPMMLDLLSRSVSDLSDYQVRKLQKCEILLRKAYPDFVAGLNPRLQLFLKNLRNQEINTFGNLSRWQYEVVGLLKDMQIECAYKFLVDRQVKDLFIPEKNTVILTLGPYAYYLSSHRETAVSKLHQRLLVLSGLNVLKVPYYEWAEVHKPADKKLYLWSLARNAASKSEQECTPLPEEIPRLDVDVDDEMELDDRFPETAPPLLTEPLEMEPPPEPIPKVDFYQSCLA